jgi:hypothetical protein
MRTIRLMILVAASPSPSSSKGLFAMSYINPAFDNFPHEEAIIGRMILAFGELEYLMVTIAGTVNGDVAAMS